MHKYGLRRRYTTTCCYILFTGFKCDTHKWGAADIVCHVPLYTASRIIGMVLCVDGAHKHKYKHKQTLTASRPCRRT